jgi:hypothetical protein
MARPSSGSGLTISQLQQILDSRKNEISKLYRKRATIEKNLAAIDREIGKLEGDGGNGGRRGTGGGGGVRARNEKSLVETLAEVLGDAKAPMSIKEIVDGVEKAGYKSSSANFRGLVNQTLIKESKQFNAPERGLYELKGTKKA